MGFVKLPDAAEEKAVAEKEKGFAMRTRKLLVMAAQLPLPDEEGAWNSPLPDEEGAWNWLTEWCNATASRFTTTVCSFWMRTS